MTHTLRKYLSKRGSALFMVLSTMTALMIVAMAMYFSVVSSRSVQYAVFNQQQSYQSAVSIADAIMAGIKDGTLASGSNSLLSAISGMGVNETISTDGNGFISLSADGAGTKEDVNQLGGYAIQITRLPDETIGGVNNKTYDIATTTSVDGVLETIHTFIHVQINPVEPPPAPDQVFASTGYVPNDQFVEGGEFRTDVFFDNENTIIGAYGSRNMTVEGNIVACGSLTVKYQIDYIDGQPFKVIVRNTLENLKNSPISPNDGGVVMVGRDYIAGTAGSGIGVEGSEEVDLYCGGDLYLRGSATFNGDVYVKGNIYIENGWSVFKGHIYLGEGSSIVNNTLNEWGGYSGGANKAYTEEVWTDTAGDMSYHEMMTELDGTTTSIPYYKWVINDSDPSLDSYVKELDERDPTKAKYHTIKINYGSTDDNGVPAYQFYDTLTYEKDVFEGCIIEGFKIGESNGSCNHGALIIDTGDDPENIFTIRATAFRDFDNDGTDESFSWYPYDTENSSRNMTVLVKGRGTVVIDIPEGVVYQDMSNVTFMHYNWWTLLGGEIGTVDGHEYYNSNGVHANTQIVDTVQFIHTECDSSCSSCTYSYPSDKETDNVCSVCGEVKEIIYCDKHEAYFEVCNTTQHVDLDGDGVKDPCIQYKKDSLCRNRVGRAEIDAYLAAHPAIANKMEKADDGSLIYPTCNIFLVSCEESASIRLSKTIGGAAIMQNHYYGFIYAPYMTFKGYGSNAGGGMVRYCGGMTVSESILDDNMAYLACWPERMPTDIMGEECFDEPMEGFGSKGWKVTFGSY